LNRVGKLLRSMYRVQDLVIGIFDGDNDDTIAVRQLEVLYQDKHVLPSDDRYGCSTTPINGELILCQLTHQVNGLYRVGKILSSIVLLILQSESVHDDTTTTMQLVFLYQDKYHTIAIVSSLDRNGEYYYL
jgi:hypothetical protein